MKVRIDYQKEAPDVVEAMFGLENQLARCGLEKDLLKLVKLRASQINGCAFCINMHTEEALAAGENPARLYLLDVWRETPLYSAREQAALAWTESVTCIAGSGVPDELFGQASGEFTGKELMNLTLAVVAINGWNRFCIACRIPPALKNTNKENPVNT